MKSRPRRIGLWVVLAFLIGFLNLGCDLEGPEAPLPNVIVIHVDDLGWADLGAYGSTYHRTPHIDRLAAEGVRFTHAYAAAAICSPSRAALQTGRYPARLGITDWIRASFQPDTWPPGTPIEPWVEAEGRTLRTPRNQPYLPQEEVTIAELLKEAGYATAHIGKWHLGPEDWWPASQGYDENHGGTDFGQPPSYFDPYANARLEGIPTLEPREEGEYLTDREADEAVRFIERHADRPFFLHLAPYAVHTPLQAKEAMAATYAAGDSLQSNPTYAAMVESVDQAVGRILETLDQRELAEQTAIFFTSDNGGLEAYGGGRTATDNAPLRDGKGSPYEGGIRVPLIVRWTGMVAPARTSEVPVSSIDLLPTIAEMADLEVEHAVDGASILSPILDDAEDVEWERDALYWHFPHYRYTQTGPYSIVRSGDWKLIRFDDPAPYGKNTVELYDLAADPAETTDLAAREPDRARALEARLEAWLDAVGARRVEIRTTPATPSTPPTP